jgi:uncharacterized protein (TIGR03435 family)
MLRKLVCLFAPAVALLAQPAAQGPAFEVASVKIHSGPLTRIFDWSSSGTRLTLEGYPGIGLAMAAYGVERYQVELSRTFSPDDATYYNITAKAPGDKVPSRSEFRSMLRALLEERFGLQVHRGTKEMPVYALVVGKNGPKFKESAKDAVFSGHMGVNGRNQSITGTRYTMTDLARGIQNSLMLDRPVVDRTGLTGEYDVKLEATPESRYRAASEFGDTSVFTAVQEQLGLKLEPQKAMIDVIVIDRLERPSVN